MSLAPEEHDWIKTPKGLFLITRAYLQGAWDAQEGKVERKPFSLGEGCNPFPPGAELSQYDYGFKNELSGFHDELDLPFKAIGK